MDIDDYFPEDKLEVGDKVALKKDKEALIRTIIQADGHFYRVAGISGMQTIKDFSFIRRKSDIEHQIKVLTSLASKKSDPKKPSYTLQDLPVYESTLIPNFGHVLRLPEGYVFANPVTFIPTTKEII